MTENFEDYMISGASIADLRKVFTEANIRPLEDSDDNTGYAFGPVEVQIPSKPEIRAAKGSSYYKLPLHGDGAALYTELKVLERSRWRNRGGKKLSSLLKGSCSSDFLVGCLEGAMILATANKNISVKKH